MAGFNDLGDTTFLNTAETTWLKLESEIKSYQKSGKKPANTTLPLELYHGLTLVQLSYIYQVKGERIKSAYLGKQGIKYLRKQKKYYESESVIAIYEYYKQQLLEMLDWIPFIQGNPKTARKKLAKYHHHSPYLGNILSTSLIWMYFDEGMYGEGLKLAEAFLKKHPTNRLYRSIRADLHFKLGRYRESRKLFLDLKNEYENIYKTYPKGRCIPIAYLSIIGNLIRVNAALGDTPNKEKYAQIWFSPETDKISSWLPKSLKKDLERFRPK